MRSGMHLLLGTCLLICGCRKPPPERAVLERTRPAKLNLHNVREWSLEINGIPFEGHNHTLLRGGNVHMHGHLEAAPGVLRPRTVPQFILALRPVGEATDRDWIAVGSRDFHLEFIGTIIRGKVDKQMPVWPDFFPPGDYEARLFFRLWDYVQGKTSVDLISTSRVTIAENSTQTADPPDPMRR